MDAGRSADRAATTAASTVPTGDAFRSAAGALLHPANLLAIATLALNDHVLKGRLPGWFTGKASDFAGLFFFPFLLEAVHEAALAATGRYRGPRTARLIAYAVVTALGFAYVKCAPGGAVAYGEVLGRAQFLVRAPLSLLSGAGLPERTLPSIVQDPTDLWALFALLGTVALAAHRTRCGEPASPNDTPAG